MLTRYMGMTAKSQSYLFTFGLAITLLGMVLTDMWLPMVAGAFILTALTVEAWIVSLTLFPCMMRCERCASSSISYNMRFVL